jgi:glycosyltransferase involved in cell wall biosynthesis
MISPWIGIIGWAIFGLWTLLLVPTMFFLIRRTLPRMTDGLSPPTTWPTLSVLVPARDEGPNIEAALQSLLASDYPALELIAINDRSTDDTGAIMDRLADEDSRLRVIHIDTLPEGWLGKNHALHLGAAGASGELLLFTDGDVVFVDDALQRAVQYVQHAKVDHLCLMPRMVTDGYWESALTTYFGFLMTAGTFIWLVPTPLKWVYSGIGAFNLVRADAYRAAGGHEPIRLDVLDDVKLGKLMKRFNYRCDILIADRLVQVKWQESAAGVIRGLEKNAFAAVEYSLWRLSLVTLFWVAVSLLPYVVALTLPDARGLGFAAAILFTHTSYALMSRQLGGSCLVFPVLPLAGVLLIWAFWRSAWITLRQRGVRWRDTFYPLDVLRRGLFR